MQDVLTIGESVKYTRLTSLGVICVDTIVRTWIKVGLMIFGILSKIFLNLTQMPKLIGQTNPNLAQKPILICYQKV